jgi:aryl-alcohol dehydrogenase-like predicted oxidoreductase
VNDLRPLGHSGLLVSPLTLGTMTMGSAGWGSDDLGSAAVLDRYLESGGNALDTADVYAGGGSEELLGRLLAERGARDGVVLAKKYGFGGGGGPVTGGSGRANMTRAVEGSLRRLRTDRIDLYWMHLWDGFTPADEVLHGMVDLVASGKIVHYGLSNVPAWFAVQVATLARAHGLPGPVALQLEYSLVSRDIEREHIRAAQEMGLAIVPWSPLAGGFLTGKYHRNEPIHPGSGRLSGANPFGDSKFTPRNWDILDTLHAVANDLGRPPAELALAWLLGRPTVATLLLGARTPDQLDPALAAVEHGLPAAARRRLDAASPPDLGNPHALFTEHVITSLIGGGTPVRLHHPRI